jgi:hypothetical protein
MTDLIDLRLGGTYDAAVAARVTPRLLPGSVRAEDPIRVDVRIRSCDESFLPTPQSGPANAEGGRLPVGTLLDCYL